MIAAGARRVIVAGAIGNVVEWYDFAIYGYFAAEIGRTFFAATDPVAQGELSPGAADGLRGT